MFFKSVRFKFIAWYMMALTLTLFAFSAVLYGAFDKALYDHYDDLLSSRAEGVTNSIDAYWSAMPPEAAEGEAARRAEREKFINIAREWVEEKRKDPSLMSIFVQILDTKGERIVATKNMPHVEALDKDDLEDLLDGEEDFNTLKGRAADGKKLRFRAYTRPVIENGRVILLVQAAGQVSLVSLALNSLRIILFFLLPLTVILAGIPGVLLARLALRPVDKMIDTLRQITAENLKLKIHLPDTKDEIRRLADTFNNMIERLDRSFSSQQNFIQDMSLELKEPLETLRNSFKKMLTGAHSPQEYESALRQGLLEADRFSRIIGDLLALASFDNRQVAFEIKKVDLNRLLGEVVGSFKNPAGDKDISLSSFLQETIIIDGDELQLKNLFWNILDNAVKYTSRKGKVAVSAHRDGKNIKATVSDTGIGIPEDEIAYVFDRFYQVKRTRNAKQGFGLGLSTSKAIAEAHNGTITVESQEGNGAIFTVTLPLSYKA